MNKTADIAITYSGLMGTRYDDPETPVCIYNLSGFKTTDFLQKNRKFMQPTLIGGSCPVLCIEQRRVDKFIEFAARHGLVAKRMSRREAGV